MLVIVEQEIVGIQRFVAIIVLSWIESTKGFSDSKHTTPTPTHTHTHTHILSGTWDFLQWVGKT